MWHKLLFWHVFSNQTEVSKILSVYVCVINFKLCRVLSDKGRHSPKCKIWSLHIVGPGYLPSTSIQKSQDTHPFCGIAKLYSRFSLSGGLFLRWDYTSLDVRAASLFPFHSVFLQADRCAYPCSKLSWVCIFGEFNIVTAFCQ